MNRLVTVPAEPGATPVRQSGIRGEIGERPVLTVSGWLGVVVVAALRVALATIPPRPPVWAIAPSCWRW